MDNLRLPLAALPTAQSLQPCDLRGARFGLLAAVPIFPQLRKVLFTLAMVTQRKMGESPGHGEKVAFCHSPEERQVNIAAGRKPLLSDK